MVPQTSTPTTMKTRTVTEIGDHRCIVTLELPRRDQPAGQSCFQRVTARQRPEKISKIKLLQHSNIHADSVV
jgi:hypothetical protein